LSSFTVPLRPTPNAAAGPAVQRGRVVPWVGTLRRGALALVLLSVAWRTLRWLLCFPVWGDEAYLALNFLDRDYLGLTEPLRCVQVAPLLFLWGELTAYKLLGGGELALRLLPFLAGLATLPLFWRLARLTLPPAARYLAVGLFAVSYYPVRHSCEIKPYALDLLVSLALLVLALTWLRRPDRLRPLALLVLLGPVGLAASYPAVFVAAAVSLVLLPAAWRQGWRARALFAAYNLLAAAGFLGPYLLAGLGQFQAAGGTHNEYWADWFPPGRPLPLLGWLLKAHTGNMLAYPAGGPNGASALTFVLVLAGAWQLVRSRRGAAVLLLVLPFALTLAAAALHRYPYGGSARIAQHLAPAVCLLMGAGLAEGIRRLARTARARRRAALAACGVLALGGVAGIAWDLGRPYKTPADREARRIVTEVLARAGPQDQVVVLRPNEDLWPTFEWYLRRQGGRVALDGRLDAARLARGGEVWALCFGGDPALPAALADQLRAVPRRLAPVRRDAYTLQFGRIEATTVRCEVLRWAER
jgi:hypothetical protein